LSEDTFHVGRADQVSIAGQLNQVIQSGLPLESALRALAEQTRSSQARRALMELSEHLERGMSLAEALKLNPNGLPRRMKALITAGLSTGRLDTIMLYIVEVSQRAISIKQQIWLALSYPMFVIWVSLVISGAMVLGVIPQFQDFFDQIGLQAGVEVPAVTRVVIRFSSMLLIFGWQPWLILAVGLLVVYLMFATIFISDSGYRWTTSIPLLGRVFRYAALTDFCRILAALAESGLPFNQSLPFAADASDDRWIVRKCQLIVQEMDRGTSPSKAASIARLPNTLCQVFRHTDAERTFPHALRGLADIYAAETQTTSQFANGLIAQVAVAFVICSTGFCTIAMTIPLVQLVRAWL
jgi:type IV pilus assembly protein PilC